MSSVTVRAPITANAVAAWFVHRAVDEPEQDLSNLKLQKLLYLAHSLYMHRHHTPLILEDVQAWENGPAVKTVYGQYKGFGPGPITRPMSSVATAAVWPEDVAEALDDIWKSFGGLSAWKLRDITHIAGPWKHHWNASTRNIVIPRDEIVAAWVEFEAFAERPLAGRANTTAAALARYSGLLGQLPGVEREGDLTGLESEARAYSDLSRRADNLLA